MLLLLFLMVLFLTLKQNRTFRLEQDATYLNETTEYFIEVSYFDRSQSSSRVVLDIIYLGKVKIREKEGQKYIAVRIPHEYKKLHDDEKIQYRIFN